LAVADDSVVNGNAPREVALAFEGSPAPGIDVSAQQEGGKKLGVGSSAAALVAALGIRYAKAAPESGNDPLHDHARRQALFAEARDVHRRAQGGGSGVDV